MGSSSYFLHLVHYQFCLLLETWYVVSFLFLVLSFLMLLSLYVHYSYFFFFSSQIMINTHKQAIIFYFYTHIFCLFVVSSLFSKHNIQKTQNIKTLQLPNYKYQIIHLIVITLKEQTAVYLSFFSEKPVLTNGRDSD